MTMLDLLRKKRRGLALTKEEIDFFVRGVTDKTLPDYQISAFLMAVCFAGMIKEETAQLTDAMARSGDLVDLSRFGTLSVDKHSTGGVGDKTTLILSPIVAALGGKVAKMSGRGLGHTGGTIDKLESIPGFRTALSPEAFMQQVDAIGLAVVGQTGNLAPADKALYALRDVTATVDSLPLIASSIMSKKIAAGSASIVLDVKCGSGAFMKTLPEARALAQEMVALGRACGRNMAALVTNMDIPLGRCIGNALEVQEAVRVLRGESCAGLLEVCVELAAQMLHLCRGITLPESRMLAQNAVADGSALTKMADWVHAQGGDAACLTDFSLFAQPKIAHAVPAQCDGWVARMDAQQFGEAAVLLGAGRLRKEDAIDMGAGIYLNKTVGEKVQKGETLFTLYTDRAEALAEAQKRCLAAITLSARKPDMQKLILDLIN